MEGGPLGRAAVPSLEGVGENLWMEGVLLDPLSFFDGVLDAVLPECISSTFSAMSLPPDLPPEKLGARLGGCVEGKLQLSLSDAEGDSLEDGVIEPVVDDDVSCFVCELPLMSCWSTFASSSC